MPDTENISCTVSVTDSANDMHEAPSIHGGNTDKLEAGHVITIEPGIYNPEIGGVRIEDMLYIDEDTTYNFNSFPKDFESMIIK